MTTRQPTRAEATEGLKQPPPVALVPLLRSSERRAGERSPREKEQQTSPQHVEEATRTVTSLGMGTGEDEGDLVVKKRSAAVKGIRMGRGVAQCLRLRLFLSLPLSSGVGVGE